MISINHHHRNPNTPATREFSDPVKAELEAICNRYPKREAALLPAMRLLEREFGSVDEPGMRHVAALIGVSPAKVFGVFTFYTHFRRSTDGKYSLQVCSTLTCALKGSEKVFDHLSTRLGIGKDGTTADGQFSLKKVECLANCDMAPCLQVNEDFVDLVTTDDCDRIIDDIRAAKTEYHPPPQKYHLPPNKFAPVLLKHVLEPGSDTIDHFLARGGYEVAKKIVHGEKQPDEVIEAVFQSGMRGRGGAGFPTGQKWKFLAKNDKPRYLVVNADESEPGTFKDKILIDRDPHGLIEGIILAAYAIRSKTSYIYIRGEFGYGARDPRPGCRRGLREGVPRQGHLRVDDRPRHHRPPRRWRVHLRRRDRPAVVPRGRSRTPQDQAAVSGGRRRLAAARRSSTTSRPCSTCRSSSRTGRSGSGASAPRRAPAPRSSASPARSFGPAATSSRSARRSRS